LRLRIENVITSCDKKNGGRELTLPPFCFG
jgi:hypothetical protein